VIDDGTIGMMGRRIAISTVFVGYDVGLKVVGENRFEVWFDNLLLEFLDVELEKFETVRGE